MATQPLSSAVSLSCLFAFLFIVDSESSDEDCVEPTSTKAKDRSKSKSKPKNQASRTKNPSTPATVSTLSEESAEQPEDDEEIEVVDDDQSGSGFSSTKSAVRGRPSASATAEIAELKKKLYNEKMTRSKGIADLEKKLKASDKKLDTTVKERDDALDELDDLRKKNEALLVKYKAVMAKLASSKSPTSAKNDGMVMQTKKITKGDLWRLVKFIGTDKQLRKAAKMVLDLLQLKDYTVCEGDSEERQQEVALNVEDWLTLYSTDIRQANNEQRSYVQSEMKKIALSWLKHGRDLPTPSEFFKLAQRKFDPEDEELMLKFTLYAQMLSAVAGSSTYGEKQRRTDCISTCETQDGKTAVPTSTEALCVVMYENCYQKWLNMHEWKEVDKNPATIPKYSSRRKEETKKWMAKFSDSCSGNSPYGGWSKEGIKKFNDLCKAFKALREANSEATKKVEEATVAWFKGGWEEERKRKRIENGKPAEEDSGSSESGGRKKRARLADDDDDDAVVAEFDEDD